MVRSVWPERVIRRISHHHATTSDDVPVRAVIPHGVEPEAFPVGAGEGDHLAYLGRMTPDKGVREAIEIARAAGVPLKIGAKMREDAEHEYFESAVRPLLGGDIEYLGELGCDDKVALLGFLTCPAEPHPVAAKSSSPRTETARTRPGWRTSWSTSGTDLPCSSHRREPGSLQSSVATKPLRYSRNAGPRSSRMHAISTVALR